MRFEAIDLTRYGHFADRRLEFPKQKCDFHLILGRNEAGKSTLRQALHDVLFGIPMDTPMSFLHPGAELEIGACLSGASGKFAFRRRRKRKGGVVDVNGEALAPDALEGWVGDVNEAFFERMFGLDHRRLEQGGRAMLQASDSVDSVLFQAAAGVSALNDVLGSLQQEAAALWAPRRSRDRAWYEAATRLAEAESIIKNSTVRPSAWLEAQRESRRLEREFEAAQERHGSLLMQAKELERLRRLAPLLAQIRQYEAVQPGGLAGSGPERSRYLEHEADIVRLEETRLRIAEHPALIERYGSRIDLLHGQLAHILRQLGRDVPGTGSEALDAITRDLPSRPLRREIEQLLQEGRQLESQEQTAARARAERRVEHSRLRDEIQALPAASIDSALRQAVDAAAAAGDIVALCEAAQRRCAQEDAQLHRRLQALAQPGITRPGSAPEAIEWAMKMKPWANASLSEQIQQRQRLQADLETVEKRTGEAEREWQAAQLELNQFRRSHRAVSRDEVVDARRQRDTLWAELAAGRVPVHTESERYAALVLLADTLADQQLQAVGDAARLQSLQHELERRAGALEGLRKARAGAVEALGAFDMRWAQDCEGRALPVLLPAEMQGWLAARDAALAAHERCLAAESEAGALAARRAKLMDDLLVALQPGVQRTLGLAEEPGGTSAPTSLGDALEEARSRVHRAQHLEARRQALSEQIARIESQLPMLQAECDRCGEARVHWEQRWHEAMLRSGLPEQAQPAYVETAVALLADADEVAGKLREAYAETRRMTAELGQFQQAARELASHLQEPGLDPSLTDTHVRRWVAGLDQARQARRAQDEARRRLVELNERLLKEGEGRSRAAIEAELDAVDVSTLAMRSDELGAALEEAAAARSALAVQCEQARTALEAVSGGDAAARAEGQRQEALADMAEVAERYVQLYAQHRLLERVTERYRERRQGPLLERAGQVFADLTLGAHAGLLVDSEAAVLHARRADGRLVPLEGLSDGTRDQLYLALRLAALELYLDHAPPLPFIADDLFVNYDDRRSSAGLQKLASVAHRTQVVFLTHHTHMADLAREAVPGQWNLIEL